MAVDASPRVLTEAIVLKRIKIGATMEPVTDENGDPMDDGEGGVLMEEVPVYAEPGDSVDVSEWANVDAWERQGFIRLTTPDIDIKVNRPEKTTGTGKAPNRPPQRHKAGGE